MSLARVRSLHLEPIDQILGAANVPFQFLWIHLVIVGAQQRYDPLQPSFQVHIDVYVNSIHIVVLSMLNVLE